MRGLLLVLNLLQFFFGELLWFHEAGAFAPYQSIWWVRVTDVNGGLLCGFYYDTAYKATGLSIGHYSQGDAVPLCLLSRIAHICLGRREKASVALADGYSLSIGFDHGSPSNVSSCVLPRNRGVLTAIS